MTWGEPLMAFDVNPWVLRAVVMTRDQAVLDFLDTRLNLISQVTAWAGRLARANPSLVAVGSPLDPWPEGLERALREEGVDLRWLSPAVMRQTLQPLQSWNLQRQLHRARMLAYIASVDPCGDKSTPEELVAQWEYRAACEVLEAVRRGLSGVPHQAVPRSLNTSDVT